MMLTLACVALVLSQSSVGDAAPVPELSVELLEGPGDVNGLWPHLVSNPAGHVIASWTEAAEESAPALRTARFDGTAWGTATTLATGGTWFVNWADFPAVAPVGGGQLLAVWLERLGIGAYTYGVRVAVTGAEAGESPVFLHSDRSQTEHGFVALAPLSAGRVAATWLDGRRTGARPPGPMALFTGIVSPSGAVTDELELDERVCDCCQTACTSLEDGRLVVAYRDRSAEEVRDISVVHGYPGKPGSWTEPKSVHSDGWNIPGCPVNGPALASQGTRVWLTWFTLGAKNEPRVWLAASEDGGANFASPLRVDAGDPVGNVDVAVLASGSAVVTWLEREPEGNVWRARVFEGESAGASVRVAEAPETRQAGFLRTAAVGNAVYAGWRDPAVGVRFARLGLSSE